MRLLRRACGPAFVIAGALHFIFPKTYRQIVPPYLPAADTLVAVSGAAEIAGGIGLMIPFTRRRAGRWLIILLCSVFPANLHMAEHPEEYPQIPGGEKLLKARLPLQALFIAWVFSASRLRKHPAAD